MLMHEKICVMPIIPLGSLGIYQYLYTNLYYINGSKALMLFNIVYYVSINN